MSDDPQSELQRSRLLNEQETLNEIHSVLRGRHGRQLPQVAQTALQLRGRQPTGIQEGEGNGAGQPRMTGL